MGFQDLELCLREALSHLHDPDYEPPDVLCALAPSVRSDGPGPVQSEIIRAIEALQPDHDTPLQAETSRAYRILHARFVLRLTLEETADDLNLSIRHLTRLQREAIHALARRLWERTQVGEAPASPRVDAPPQADEYRQRSGWREQVREELAALDRAEAEPTCSLAVVVPGALRIARALMAERQIAVTSNAAPPEPKVLMHASVLQHILLSLTESLATPLDGGASVGWRVEHCALGMRITMSTIPATRAVATIPDIVHELLGRHGGEVTVGQSGNTAPVILELPSEKPPEERAVILAIDDNAGLVSLFQSYCKGTRYEIMHIAEGRRAIEAVAQCRPKAILLDVLLPDVDGWGLLVELRRHVASRSIPIILCSVTRDERLALGLGANLYLPKPVWREQLLEALDQVLSQAEAALLTDAANKPAACQ